MSQAPKEIIFEEEAREHLFSGIKQLADVVAVTLGPIGRNVGIEQSWGPPRISSDGSTIVKDISLKNTFENMGVSIAKEVVQKMKEKCGDGTTTVILLLSALVDNGLKQVAAGSSPIGIKRGIDKAVDVIVEAIKKNTTPVKNSADIRNIATVSASGDEDIGNIIAEAMQKVGKTGVITIEEAKGTDTVIEKVDGMQFDRGYLSPYFCTNTDKSTVEMTNPQLLLIDYKVSNIHDLLPILQATATSGRELLIIAEDIDSEPLATLVFNKVRGTLKVAAVKAPGFGDRRKAMLQDIAALTGATLASEDTGTKAITAAMLGSAERVTISKDNTVIINGGGEPVHIKARIQQIEQELEAATSSYDKEKLQERKAKLSGGVAVIRVGAMTEPELKRRKQVFEDSLNSTKAAQEDGLVLGGGIALLQASKAIDKLIASNELTGDEVIGARVVKQACQAPIKQIATNAGFGGPVVLVQVSEAPANCGFNARTGKIEDMVTAGIIDPAKVVINALLLAASAAGIVILSEVLIADAKEDDKTDAA